MNKVIISGRMVRDPELKSTNNGTEVCNFTVAVDRRYKKGEEKKVDFINCTAWSAMAAFVNEYFKKGKGINVSGRLESDKYAEEDGKNRTSWHVTAESIEFAIIDSMDKEEQDKFKEAVDIEEADLPF